MPFNLLPRRLETVSTAAVALLFFLVVLGGGLTGCTDADDSPSQNASSASADRSILLNIGLTIETEDRPLSDSFVVEGPDSVRWSPDLSEDGGFVTKEFGEYPVGADHEFSIYPNGEDGPRLTVPFAMKADMSSALASSRTEITVRDDQIVVEGPAVRDGKMEFDRPGANAN